jgi:hypothetical protein
VQRDSLAIAVGFSGDHSLFVRIPGMRLQSTANLREHHMVKAKRTKKQRGCAKMVVGSVVRGIPWTESAYLLVTITRVAPRELDDDNLATACKATRDGIADALGINDRDPRVKWQYAQAKGQPKEYAVNIRIESTDWM